MSEARDTRIKRLKLRSIRRGIREMDLLLGAFVEDGLERLTDAELDAYERLLDEPDPDILSWITGAVPCPAEHAPLVGRLAAEAHAAARPERFLHL